jgi:hypothetical protein
MSKHGYGTSSCASTCPSACLRTWGRRRWRHPPCRRSGRAGGSGGWSRPPAPAPAPAGGCRCRPCVSAHTHTQRKYVHTPVVGFARLLRHDGGVGKRVVRPCHGACQSHRTPTHAYMCTHTHTHREEVPRLVLEDAEALVAAAQVPVLVPRGRQRMPHARKDGLALLRVCACVCTLEVRYGGESVLTHPHPHPPTHTHTRSMLSMRHRSPRL